MDFTKKIIKHYKNYISPLIDNKKPDYILFIVSSMLIIIGVIFSYSLTIYTVDYYEYSQFHYFLRQFIVGVIAILIMWILGHIRPKVLFEKWKIAWWLFWVFSTLLIVMHLLPTSIVNPSGGATRWIRLPGFSITPVEFFKIGFIFLLSHSFNKRFGNLKKISFKEEILMLLPYGIVYGIVVFLIAFLQKDLGQVFLLGSIIFIMLIFINRSFKVFGLIISIAIVGVIVLIQIALHRITRFQSWWGMKQDVVLSIFPENIQEMLTIKEYTEPYQVFNSLSAIYNGGWTGVGLGEGTLKLGFLSEVHTDFVLAGITEEIGVLGILMVFLLQYIVIFRILRIARRTGNNVFHLFCLGIGLMIGISLLINGYGISSLIPVKGIAVPFLSYGGSALLSLGIAIGMVLSISKELDNSKTHKRKKLKS